MHELSIVLNLIEQVSDEIERSGSSGRVIGLDLVIGRLSGVHVDAIRFAFEAVAANTVLDGAELRIAQPAAYCDCHECGVRSKIEEMELRCPACGGTEIRIAGGRDLLLQSIELQAESKSHRRATTPSQRSRSSSVANQDRGA